MIPDNAKVAIALLALVSSLGYFGFDRYRAATDPMRAAKPHLGTESSAALSKLSSARVILFGTSWCPYCAQARALFARLGVNYVEFDIERDRDGERFARQHLKLRSVPNIVIGNRVLVGYDEPEIIAALKEE